MKILALFIGFFLSTGIILPWIISNDIMPVSLSIIMYCSFFFAWYLILKEPALQLTKKLYAMLKDLSKNKDL